MASATLSVCVCTLKGKRLELSTPNLVRVYSTAVARDALTRRSKGQKSRSKPHRLLHVAVTKMRPWVGSGQEKRTDRGQLGAKLSQCRSHTMRQSAVGLTAAADGFGVGDVPTSVGWRRYDGHRAAP